jgi:hypothetical protein
MLAENKHPNLLQTPHNIFVQVFVSGGVIGLCFWILMAGYAVMILTFDLIRNKRLLNTPVIISIISFHIFGIFQSMQYIPMIWLLIFLSLGYAMTIDDGVLPDRVRRVTKVLTKVSVVLVIVGFFVYLGNFESRSLAKKYGMNIYATDQDRDRFAGFFQESQRWKYGDYRWCGKRGSVRVRRAQGAEREAQRVPGSTPVRSAGPTGQAGQGIEVAGQGQGNGAVEIEFYCRTPGVEKEPVVVRVLHDGKMIDEISFAKKGSVRRRYELEAQSLKQSAPRLNTLEGNPVQRGREGRERRAVSRKEREQKLLLEVSRTWIPHEHLGNFDRRKLGIGVKIVKSE